MGTRRETGRSSVSPGSLDLACYLLRKRSLMRFQPALTRPAADRSIGAGL